MNINKNFNNLKENYLFADIGNKVAEFAGKNPKAKIIKLGIGDVTLPLCEAVTNAVKSAANEMGKSETFRGYPPYEGYEFLRAAIKKYYGNRDINISMDEIFISDGAKSDVSNILDLFDKNNTVLIPDPVYPVYMDTNIMDGRKIIYMDANVENGFLPLPDKNVKADIIYICSPNNPTGAVYNREQLKLWVDYANANEAVILFDAAYEGFIKDCALPRSIFEIEGANTCAVEICSFSKTAGFTGTRCGYTIISRELKIDGTELNRLWLRRQATKFNGVSYMIQKGAEAVFTEDGYGQIQKAVNYYMENAKIIAEAVSELGISFTGGVNSPYIWLKCPNNMKSWEFFDLLLEKANVVGTPGSGFGVNGEGFFRLTAFGSKENTKEAAERIKVLLK